MIHIHNCAMYIVHLNKVKLDNLGRMTMFPGLSHVHDESETWIVQAGTRPPSAEVGVGRVCS